MARPRKNPIPVGASIVRENFVTIECTSDKKPWTDSKKLDLGERVTVSEAIAVMLVSSGLAKVV